MICEACERGDCWDCEMQPWCECEGFGPEAFQSSDSTEPPSSPNESALPDGWWIVPVPVVGAALWWGFAHLVYLGWRALQ